MTKDVNVFNQLLAIDVIRGKDSTGVLGYNRHSKAFEVIKDAVDPLTLMQYKRYDGVASMHKNVLLGHNRSATIGGVNRANAHPFISGRLAGVHNGTLPHDARKQLKGYDQFGTDSEALFNNLDEFEVTDVIKDIWGAWSLVWVDREENTLNFLRNKERPMHFCFNADRTNIYWASELWMLQGVLGREGVKVEDDKYFYTTEDTLFTYDIPNSRGKWAVARQSKVPGGAPPATTFHQGSAYGGFSGNPYESKWDEVNRRYQQQHKKPDTEAEKSPKKGAEIIALPDRSTKRASIGAGVSQQTPLFRNWNMVTDKDGTEHYRTIDGNRVTKYMWSRLQEHECAMCSKTVEWGQPIAFTRDINGFLCEECFSEPTLADYAGI